jgi:hypothetical protein
MCLRTVSLLQRPWTIIVVVAAGLMSASASPGTVAIDWEAQQFKDTAAPYAGECLGFVKVCLHESFCWRGEGGGGGKRLPAIIKHGREGATRCQLEAAQYPHPTPFVSLC